MCTGLFMLMNMLMSEASPRRVAFEFLIMYLYKHPPRERDKSLSCKSDRSLMVKWLWKLLDSGYRPRKHKPVRYFISIRKM